MFLHCVSPGDLSLQELQLTEKGKVYVKGLLER